MSGLQKKKRLNKNRLFSHIVHLSNSSLPLLFPAPTSHIPSPPDPLLFLFLFQKEQASKRGQLIRTKQDRIQKFKHQEF